MEEEKDVGWLGASAASENVTDAVGVQSRKAQRASSCIADGLLRLTHQPLGRGRKVGSVCKNTVTFLSTLSPSIYEDVPI